MASGIYQDYYVGCGRVVTNTVRAITESETSGVVERANKWHMTLRTTGAWSENKGRDILILPEIKTE